MPGPCANVDCENHNKPEVPTTVTRVNADIMPLCDKCLDKFFAPPPAPIGTVGKYRGGDPDDVREAREEILRDKK